MISRTRIAVVFGVMSAIGLAALAVAIWIASANGVEVWTLVPRVRKFVSGLGFGAMTYAAILLLALMVLEIVLVGWSRSSAFRLVVRRNPTSILDIAYFVSLVVGLLGALQIVLTLGASVAMGSFVNWATAQLGWYRITLPSGGVPETLFSFSVYYLASTFFAYWGHRLMHLPAFWHLHRFHHAATELNMVTTFRQHPIEGVILNFIGVISPLTFLQVSNDVLLLFFVWGTMFEILAHSQLPWSFGWFGRWVVASPTVHQIHHSVDPEHQDLHYSNCPLWDHLFGTWYKGSNAPSAYGIAEPVYEQRPLTQFAYDLWTFYVGWVQRLFAPIQRRLVREPSSPVSRPTHDGTVL